VVEEKELPSEYVSIRHVWLQAINDCRKAIGQRAVQEPTEERSWREIGDRNVAYMVTALYHSLVDYGEALIRTDVDRYYKDTFKIRTNKIWDRYVGYFDEKKFKKEYGHLEYSEREKKKEELKEKLLSGSTCWDRHARESIELFDFIIQTLNKYDMLFDEQPQGYSNVEMKSV